MTRRRSRDMRDAAPVIAARALLAYGTDDETVVAYVQRTWRLTPLDARAAVAAAHVISRDSRR
jgi:hypothetical protein